MKFPTLSLGVGGVDKAGGGRGEGIGNVDEGEGKG